jgi:hypothetical protein
MNCKTLLAGMAVAILLLTTGCGNTPTIEITTPPPASMEVNQFASIAAALGHDSKTDSVDWSCTPAGSCGTFTPPNTASGAMTEYKAPDASGPVMIIAASHKNPKVKASANVNITAVATATDITGTYTFFVNGREKEELLPYGVAGNIAINGATGKVTSGEQDYFNSETGVVFEDDPITAGTIVVGSDGRGTLTLTPTSAPAETFSITVVNDKHILITQFDSNATASGSLDLQTAPSSVPTGHNAFALLDSFNGNAFGGVFTSNGTITTASEADDDIGGSMDFTLVNFITASFTTPDANGRGTVTLTDANLTPALFSSSFTLAYYVVGPEAFRLIEIDGETTLSPQYAVGSIFGQGAGNFANMKGSPFVFGQSGIEVGTNIGAFSAAGQFTGNGTNTLSAGVADVNEGDGNPIQAGSLTGSPYVVQTNGYGAITLTGLNTDGLANFGIYAVDPAINVADPNSASGGGGALMLDLDTSNIGIGIVVPQATGPTFSGNYAFSQDGVFQTAAPLFAWYGLLGEVTSDGTSKFAGLADYNELNVAQTPAVTISATYAADPANTGRITSQVTINGAATPNHVTIYQASSSLLLHVDVDSSAAGLGNVELGVLEQQQ